MSDEPKRTAKANTTELWEVGDRAILCRRTPPSGDIGRLLLLVVAGILGIIGIHAIASAQAPWLGLICLGLSAVFLYAAYKSPSPRVEPPTGPTEQVLFVIDRAEEVLIDGSSGEVLAPLEETRTGLGWQATASSQKLVLTWPGGTHDITRGLAGPQGLYALQKRLRELGIRSK